MHGAAYLSSLRDVLAFRARTVLIVKILATYNLKLHADFHGDLMPHRYHKMLWTLPLDIWSGLFTKKVHSVVTVTIPFWSSHSIILIGRLAFAVSRTSVLLRIFSEFPSQESWNSLVDLVPHRLHLMLWILPASISTWFGPMRTQGMQLKTNKGEWQR